MATTVSYPVLNHDDPDSRCPCCSGYFPTLGTADAITLGLSAIASVLPDVDTTKSLTEECFFQSVSTLRAAFPSVDYSQLYGASYLCCHRIPSCDRKQVLLAGTNFWLLLGILWRRVYQVWSRIVLPQTKAICPGNSDYPRAAVLNIFLCHC